MLYYGVLVPSLLLLDRVQLVLGLPGELEGDGSSEGDLGPDLVLASDVTALLDCLRSTLGLHRNQT